MRNVALDRVRALAHIPGRQALTDYRRRCLWLLTAAVFLLALVCTTSWQVMPVCSWLVPVIVLMLYAGLHLLRRRMLTDLQHVLTVSVLMDGTGEDPSWVYQLVAQTSAVHLRWKLQHTLAMAVVCCGAYASTRTDIVVGVGIPCLFMVLSWVSAAEQVELTLRQKVLERALDDASLV